jgi:hypothetical protein
MLNLTDKDALKEKDKKRRNKSPKIGETSWTTYKMYKKGNCKHMFGKRSYLQKQFML